MSIRKHIPNALTLCNLLCGCIGCMSALEGEPLVTFYCVIASGVFDFLDGFCARLLKAYSEIGKELDSLADLISFGLSPALTLFVAYREGNHAFPPLAYSALLIAAFSALRLAKFNLDERQTKSFLGLPTPACALLAVPLCAYAAQSEAAVHTLMASEWFVPALSIALSLLLVSEIPMLSLKGGSSALKMFFVGSILLVTVTAVFVECNVCLLCSVVFTFYILLNIGLVRRGI
ncbi:MAG: CDP-diacylglycerol--serine O-phosphatidyltransferase [Bacteroidales bacterium]|nr:CDP-diacylglycerol--serine O-phosphatidyltransferase [Candidatus Cacconaster caballi]